MRLATLLLAGLVLAGGCRPSAIETMANTTKLIDSQAAATYEVIAEDCLQQSPGWVEYDLCVLKVVENVHTVYPLPATIPALTSKWSRKC
jgi:hypothetical protein